MRIESKDEKELESLDFEEEKANSRARIAAAKRVEREYRREYGPNWRHILGIVGKAVSGIRVNRNVGNRMMGRRGY